MNAFSKSLLIKQFLVVNKLLYTWPGNTRKRREQLKKRFFQMELPSSISKLLFLVTLMTTSHDLENVTGQPVSLKRTLDSGIRYAQFGGNSFTELTNSSFATLKVESLGECTFQCINSQKCFSVNFAGHQTQGKHICELLNEDKFSRSDKVVSNDDFHHYHIKVGLVAAFIFLAKRNKP